MFSNYLKSAWRNLLKGRMYTMINLVGLSIGTAVVILLTLYVNDEWTFDHFHEKSDRIYRAWVKEHVQDEVFFNTLTPYLLGQELRDNFPQIELVARYTTLSSQIRKGNFTEQENVHVVETEFLKVFDFKLISGLKDNLLTDIHSAVITGEMGLKYFGDADAVGQTLTMQVGGQWTDFTVTGIIEKAPGNSSLQYDILIPFEITKTYMSEGGRNSWTNVSVETFVVINDPKHAKALEAQIAPFLDAKVASIYKPGEYLMGLQPLTDIHLNKDFPKGFIQTSDARYPYIVGGVALLILLLACINFTTLAIGRSVSRSKEVGVRKVTGATRSQIMTQFWSEAVLTSTIGVVLGIVIAKILLPEFNTLSDKSLQLTFTPLNSLAFGALALITGIIAGGYPAAVLSGFSPIRSLRGSGMNMSQDKYLVLRMLVGVQFLLSVLLIISTIVMTQQLQFLQTKNLGFEKEQVLILPYHRSGARLTELFEEGKGVAGRLRHTLGGNPAIRDIAMSTHAIGTPGWMELGYPEPGTEKFRKFHLWAVDDKLLPMINVEFISGRNFSGDVASDNRAVLVNETYAREFNVQTGMPLQEPFQEYTVIGLVKDFNYASLHSEVGPLLLAVEPVKLVQTASDMMYQDYPNPKLWIKVAGDDLFATISVLRQAWLEAAPEQPFNYVFLDENIDQQYRAEQRLGTVISIASVLAVFIACLGLFGIVTLTVARRTKEIGIRKVMGATATQVVGILSRDFIKLVMLAVIPAIPIAWFVMQTWLEDFAYRIDIHWSVFIIAGALAMVLAFSTICIQSIRAAMKNPVASLRSE